MAIFITQEVSIIWKRDKDHDAIFIAKVINEFLLSFSTWTDLKAFHIHVVHLLDCCLLLSGHCKNWKWSFSSMHENYLLSRHRHLLKSPSSTTTVHIIQNTSCGRGGMTRSLSDRVSTCR